MKLADLIDYLVEIQNTHGNVDVWTYDVELGMALANPGLAKVLVYDESDGDKLLQHFNQEFIARVKNAPAEDYQEIWDNLSEQVQQSWGGWDSYISIMNQAAEQRKRFLERWDAAPFAVVF